MPQNIVFARMAIREGIIINFRFYLLFLFLTILVFPLHESAHYLMYRALWVHLHMTLNTASPTDQSKRRAIAELAGPLLNLSLAAFSLLMLKYSRSARVFWAATALSAALMRLSLYVLILVFAVKTGSGMVLGNDEPISAHMWGLPSLTFVGLIGIPLSCVVWMVVGALAGSRLFKLLTLIGFGLTTFGVGILIGSVIDPWLFPHR